MLVFQCTTPEQLRTDVVTLIQQQIRQEKNELTNAPTKRAQAVSQGIINALHYLADTIAEARIEPRPAEPECNCYLKGDHYKAPEQHSFGCPWRYQTR